MRLVALGPQPGSSPRARSPRARGHPKGPSHCLTAQLLEPAQLLPGPHSTAAWPAQHSCLTRTAQLLPFRMLTVL